MRNYSGLAFLKLSGTGNDFILFDNREAGLSEHDVAFFRRICRRRTSVGADGVLLLEAHPEYDFRLRYFNADGSETACGNGARCGAFAAVKLGLTRSPVSFVFGKSLYEAQVDGKLVRLKMPGVKDLRERVGLQLDGAFSELGFVNTGVPHFVVATEEIDSVDVVRLGRRLRGHEVFGPEGTNVDFVKLLAADEIQIRTYERGVEGETLSCGTGCVAAAYLVRQAGRGKFPMRLQTRGGVLRVDEEHGRLFLEGEVAEIYAGKLL
ncbi:MAG: diaminopimelate epimerase [Calditrichaeota bacterium]|nr:MAG: diaminopimelate epimerase [Calditrichota bacterium]